MVSQELNNHYYHVAGGEDSHEGPIREENGGGVIAAGALERQAWMCLGVTKKEDHGGFEQRVRTVVSLDLEDNTESSSL